MGIEAPRASLDVLVVEDDRDIADSVAGVLREQGHHPTVLPRGDQALRRLGERAYDLLICDVRLPGADGMAILRRARADDPEVPIILMSAYGSIPEAVRAVREEGAHYLEKPFGIEQLVDAVDEVERAVTRRGRLTAARARRDETPDAALVGQTPAILALRRFVRKVAQSDGAVLITGETGTGKELVARTIHELSARQGQPFVALNCAAFPDTLLEAELFGHERGAFTGAVKRREGRFRAAHGGTLFLDEVGDMPGGAQAKLLRVLEDGDFQPLGSDRTLRADVRIVSATNADLRTGSRLREDLFYRLKLFHIRMPPLRERMHDLSLLVDHFLSKLADTPAPSLTPRAWSALELYDYPGNVRELRHAVQHALAISGGDEIDVKHLPEEFQSGAPVGTTPPGGIQPLEEAERAFQRDYLLRALRRTDGNRTRAAGILGVSRKTLWKKLRQLDIDDEG